MSLFVVGLNHQTAPVSIRERLAFPESTLGDALSDAAKQTLTDEVMILSTCNRTELYAVGDAATFTSWWAHYHHLTEAEIRPYLYLHDGKEAVHHAFRVACGLDSMVLGEPQILGQLKDAVRHAQQSQTIDSVLNMLFQRTFSVAKNIRTHTALGEHSVSMAAASVKMAAQIFPTINQLNVLFIGAGEMIELVATYFAAENPQKITVANRTPERAQELLASLNYSGQTQAVALSDLPNLLADYDVVVSSTASPLPIVGKGMVENALRRRRNKPLFLLDLAVPRDIESQVADLSNAFLYTVDDMADIVQSGRAARQRAASEAETMINEQVRQFIDWQKSRATVPLIRQLRHDADEARLYVLNNALHHLARGETPEAALERLSIQLTNKLMHAPTKALNQSGKTPDDELINAICHIYHLDS